MALVVNLARRSDRIVALKKLQLPFEWERLDACDGRNLAWNSLSDRIHADAIREAVWAEKQEVPTICRRTGSFSPHLTLAAAGCALSHRKAWETLLADPKAEHALIMEDDLSASECDTEAISVYLPKAEDDLSRRRNIHVPP